MSPTQLRRSSILALGTLLLSAFVTHAQIVQLPPAITSANSLSDSQISDLATYTALHATELAQSTTPKDTKTHRDYLLSPLNEKTVSTDFRTTYSDLLLQNLTPMLAPDAQQDKLINAITIIGELATRKAFKTLEPNLTHPQAAIRCSTYFAYARSFRAIETQTAIALPQQQVTNAINALANAFKNEDKPAVHEAYVHALAAAARIPESRMSNVRPTALNVLSTTVGTRANDISPRTMLRASAALFTEIKKLDRAYETLPPQTLQYAGQFAGDTLTMIHNRVQAQTLDEDQRQLLALLTLTAENILTRLGALPDTTSLSQILHDGRDKAFMNDVAKILGPTGPLAAEPLNLDTTRFKLN